jgi:hypothetical protein
MCYYIQKVYGFEILKMRAEFNKDENGTVRSLNIMLIDMVLLCIIDHSKTSEGKRSTSLNQKDHLRKSAKQAESAS